MDEHTVRVWVGDRDYIELIFDADYFVGKSEDEVNEEIADYIYSNLSIEILQKGLNALFIFQKIFQKYFPKIFSKIFRKNRAIILQKNPQ